MKKCSEYTKDCRDRKKSAGLVPLRITEQWCPNQQVHDELKTKIYNLISETLAKTEKTRVTEASR